MTRVKIRGGAGRILFDGEELRAMVTKEVRGTRDTQRLTERQAARAHAQGPVAVSRRDRAIKEGRTKTTRFQVQYQLQYQVTRVIVTSLSVSRAPVPSPNAPLVDAGIVPIAMPNSKHGTFVTSIATYVSVIVFISSVHLIANTVKYELAYSKHTECSLTYILTLQRADASLHVYARDWLIWRL
jgi:hypothetical protein